MTVLGVCGVFLAKPSAITLALTSMRYISRQLLDISFIRNSWHRGPMLGMGLDCGIVSASLRCGRLGKKPASRRPAWENGGVLTSPCSQAYGIFFRLTSPSDVRTNIIANLDLHTSSHAAAALSTSVWFG